MAMADNDYAPILSHRCITVGLISWPSRSPSPTVDNKANRSNASRGFEAHQDHFALVRGHIGLAFGVYQNTSIRAARLGSVPSQHPITLPIHLHICYDMLLLTYGLSVPQKNHAPWKHWGQTAEAELHFNYRLIDLLQQASDRFRLLPLPLSAGSSKWSVHNQPQPYRNSDQSRSCNWLYTCFTETATMFERMEAF